MGSFKHTNINGAHTTIVSSKPCKLHSLVINTTSSAAITLYNNAATAGSDIIAVFPASAICGTYIYDIDLSLGLVVVTAGTGDITLTTGSEGN